MRSTMNMPAFFVGQHDDDPRAEAVRVIHDPDPAEEYALTLTLSGCDVYLTLDAAREIAEKLSGSGDCRTAGRSVSILPTLRSRLVAHTCPGDSCGDVLCAAAREIEQQRDRIGQMEMWVCAHWRRLDGSGKVVQCADCAGIIHSPELIALRRAERAEALLRRITVTLNGEDLRDGVSETVAEWLAQEMFEAGNLLAEIDARSKITAARGAE